MYNNLYNSEGILNDIRRAVRMVLFANESEEYLMKASQAPSDVEMFAEWKTQKDTETFFHQNLKASEIILYGSIPFFFLTSALVPLADLEKDSSADLISWDGTGDDSWSVGWSMREKDKFIISAPMTEDASKTLHNAEQLVFCRDFAGYDLDDRHYIEISQKMTHLLGLHFVKSRNAYCRLDKHGDLEDVIRIIIIPPAKDYRGGTVVTIAREVLENYMVMTVSRLVLMFDITRYREAGFGGWSEDREEQRVNLPEGQARLTVDTHGSYQRGYQVINPAAPFEEVAARIRGEETTPRKYVTFIMHDWKNKKLIEHSCDPKELASYFVSSDLPFEISPVFFRADVLLKYKSDPNKYYMNERYISCRGGWSLKTYDINEAGQLHTYAIYLSRLPYEEQLYWKSFNEEPKAPISPRALKNDFNGEFDDTYNPLNHVKSITKKLNEQHAEWWKLRNDSLLDKLNYPVTTSETEWINEIITLNQLLTEGLEEAWLRKKAKQLGRTPEAQWRSIVLLAECLIGLGFEEGHVRELIGPLRELQNLRSKLGGTHASGSDAKKLKHDALNQHGSFQRHFSDLCAKCAEAFDIIGVEITKQPQP